MKYRLLIIVTIGLILLGSLISMSTVSVAGWEGEHDTNAGVNNLIPSHRLRHVLDESSSMIHTVYLPLIMGGSTEAPPPGPTPSPTPSLTPSPTLEPTPSPSPTITPEPTPEPEGWNIIQLPGSGSFPSLALDSNNSPHISFAIANKEVGYMLWDGNDWQVEIVDTLGMSTSPRHLNAGMALDENDRPHIAYPYWTSDGYGRIGYARWDGNLWQKTYITNVLPYYAAISLDGNGDACISYLRYGIGMTPSWSIWFRCHTETGWGLSNLVDTVSHSIWYDHMQVHSIALGSDGLPHFSYYSGRRPLEATLMYKGRVDSTWVKTEVDATQGVGSYSSLALDSQDLSHISYYDHKNHNLKYARWDGSIWNVETVESNGDVGFWTSLALDEKGHPHISYIDVTNRHLKYAFWDGSQWNIEAIDDSGNVWRYTSLAMDESGFVHISYVTLEGNKLGLMYATNSGFPGE